jgi:hypothetical protein
VTIFWDKNISTSICIKTNIAGNTAACVFTALYLLDQGGCEGLDMNTRWWKQICTKFCKIQKFMDLLKIGFENVKCKLNWTD